MDLIGLPLILATRAAAPAVEPRSIEPALRNSSALLEPSVCTQTMAMPSLANSLQDLLLLEHHRDRVVGRPVDADFLRLVGGVAARAGSKQQGGGDKAKAGQRGHDDLRSFGHGQPSPLVRAAWPGW